MNKGIVDQCMADTDSSSDSPCTPAAENLDSPFMRHLESKYFNDPVHGGFHLGAATCAFVDTKPFQRLRHLKQLGFSYYVYPGASHNRFEHCLGVGHLAGKWARSLMQYNRLPHEEIDRCARLVEIAGLCHDLGHGPFSHDWELSILPSLGVQNWCHERMSATLVEYIFDRHDIEDRFDLNRNDMTVVQNLIAGKKPTHLEYYSEMPAYLFDIVNNQTSGIDVDKMDYLQRDALHSHVTVSAPYDRFLDFAKTDDQNILFRMREMGNFVEMFKDRMKMHRIVYKHKITVAIQLMVSDALHYVGHELQLAARSHNPDAFLKLKDSLLEYVYEHYESDTPGAQRAKELCRRIESRQLYTLCGEMTIPERHIPWFLANRVTATDITTRQKTDGQANLRPDDIHVFYNYVDYGMKDKNPIRRVRCYHERPEEISTMAEQIEPIQRLSIRVYCKDKKHEDAVRAAFESFKRSSTPELSTPDRTERGGLEVQYLSE